MLIFGFGFPKCMTGLGIGMMEVMVGKGYKGDVSTSTVGGEGN